MLEKLPTPIPYTSLSRALEWEDMCYEIEKVKLALPNFVMCYLCWFC